VIASATLAGKSPVALARTAWKLGCGTLQARSLLRSLKPDAVVGFGGYPTFPPMLAAWLTGTPSVLHEANAVMGRANRMLATRASAIATSFPLAARPDRAIAARMVRTGNPVRDAVIAAAAPYREPQPEGRFDLLVFGGSQGARFFSDALPQALQCLDGHLRRRIRLVQQCRPEDLERVKTAYDALGLEAELAPFFADMPERIAGAHLVICRSGASSVSELSVIGRPSILVPLPHSLDNDQGRNAEVLAEAGGAWPIAQKDLDGPALARQIIELMNAPDRLSKAAAAARDVGRPDAVRRLADLVEHVASRRPISELADGDQSEETPS
jgi:UDP-N-acetylglucosamine--N-acetylmuramyl-(pentapeptide) pyrophosphoryl-undecaprenol N-acetylglucosamine transferase